MENKKEGSEHIPTNIQETDSPRGPFTEEAGSDCCLQFCLLWMALNSIQNFRHRKLENATVETQEQDLVLSSRSSSCKGDWSVTQKAISMPTCR